MKKKLLIKFKFVNIVWSDAQSDCEWSNLEKIQEWAEKDCIVYESGWLICESSKYLVICNQFGEDGDFGNRTKIPKQWILRRSDKRGKKK